jgi:hypothetical protein
MGVLLGTCDRGATYSFLCVHLRLMIDIEARGLIELVQHLAYRRSFHRRKGAARHWYGLTIAVVYPSGEEGRCFICSNDFYLPSRRLVEGKGEVSTLWSVQCT